MKSPPMQWHEITSQHPHWFLWSWAACVGLGIFLETYAVVRGRKYPTFTTLVKKGAPRWAVAAVLGWLAWHFLIEP
jgi:hypothetical protein